MAAGLAHGPGMTTSLFRAGMLSGGLHLQDPHAHVHHPWWAESELGNGQGISWGVHTAWLVWPRVDCSLGWRCSSRTASSNLPPRLPATSQCSSLWASPLCWLWRWGKAALCLSPGCYSPADCSPARDAHASAATLLGCLTDSLFVLFSFPPTCINLVGFNLIASFSDRLSQEQCKWALKCGDLVYICQLIAWVAQTSRAGTCLLVLRSLISDPMLHVEAELLMEEDVFFGQHLVLGESGLNSLDWVCITLQTPITEAVAQCRAAWICSLRGELTQASPSEVPAFFPICLSLLCDHMHLYCTCMDSLLPEIWLWGAYGHEQGRRRGSTFLSILSDCTLMLEKMGHFVLFFFDIFILKKFPHT